MYVNGYLNAIQLQFVTFTVEIGTFLAFQLNLLFRTYKKISEDNQKMPHTKHRPSEAPKEEREMTNKDKTNATHYENTPIQIY